VYLYENDTVRVEETGGGLFYEKRLRHCCPGEGVSTRLDGMGSSPPWHGIGRWVPQHTACSHSGALLKYTRPTREEGDGSAIWQLNGPALITLLDAMEHEHGVRGIITWPLAPWSLGPQFLGQMYVFPFLVPRGTTKGEIVLMR
jgi:hypothetical protein